MGNPKENWVRFLCQCNQSSYHFHFMQYQQSLHGLYLFNSNELCQLSARTGRINKFLRPIANIKSEISLVCQSSNGAHLMGLVTCGDMFIWHKLSNVVETHITPFSKMGMKNSNRQTFSGNACTYRARNRCWSLDIF